MRPASWLGPGCTMAPTVGLGTLRRLAELDPGDGPMLSVYLSLDPHALTACDAELAALAAASERAEVTRVRVFLRSLPAFAQGTRGLGLFCHGSGSQLEVVPLPESVATTAVLDTRPWLEPLASCAGAPAACDPLAHAVSRERRAACR